MKTSTIKPLMKLRPRPMAAAYPASNLSKASLYIRVATTSLAPAGPPWVMIYM